MWTTLRALEVDDGIAAGVARPVVLGGDALVAERFRPDFVERGVGHDRRGGRRRRVCRRLRGHLLLKLGDLDVSDELLRRCLEDRVSAGVVAVMMGVEGHIDAAAAGALAEAVDAQLRGVGVLRVDRDECLFVREPPDGAAARGEIADVASNGSNRGCGGGGCDEPREPCAYAVRRALAARAADEITKNSRRFMV